MLLCDCGNMPATWETPPVCSIQNNRQRSRIWSLVSTGWNWHSWSRENQSGTILMTITKRFGDWDVFGSAGSTLIHRLHAWIQTEPPPHYLWKALNLKISVGPAHAVSCVCCSVNTLRGYFCKSSGLLPSANKTPHASLLRDDQMSNIKLVQMTSVALKRCFRDGLH